jgi:hypothetical protein
MCVRHTMELREYYDRLVLFVRLMSLMEINLSM